MVKYQIMTNQFPAPKISGIYKITNPKGDVYIGQSVDCERRKLQYKRGMAKRQPRLYNSIKKYGWDAHKFEVIGYCDPQTDWLDDMEKRFISLLGSFYADGGLNLTRGGGGSFPETRRKISESIKGKTLAPEHVEAIRRSLLGNHIPLDVRQKIGEAQRGPKNHKWGTGKPVLQFTLDGALVRRFSSAKAVERELGIPFKNIQSACRYNAGLLPSGTKRKKPVKARGQYTSKGYIWKYE